MSVRIRINYSILHWTCSYENRFLSLTRKQSTMQFRCGPLSELDKEAADYAEQMWTYFWATKNHHEMHVHGPISEPPLEPLIAVGWGEGRPVYCNHVKSIERLVALSFCKMLSSQSRSTKVRKIACTVWHTNIKLQCMHCILQNCSACTVSGTQIENHSACTVYDTLLDNYSAFTVSSTQI